MSSSGRVSLVGAQHRESYFLTSINAVLSTRLYYFLGGHTEGPLLLWRSSLEDVSTGKIILPSQDISDGGGFILLEIVQ